VPSLMQASSMMHGCLLGALTDHQVHHLQPWGRLYRKDRFSSLRFPPLHGPEDIYLLADFYANVKQMTVIPEKLYAYRYCAEGLSQNGMPSFRRYMKGWPLVALHFEELCLAGGVERKVRLRLVRKYGAGSVFLQLFDCLSDARLSVEEKEECLRTAATVLKNICSNSTDGWRIMPFKYLHLYPSYVRNGSPWMLNATVALRNRARQILLKLRRIIKS